MTEPKLTRDEVIALIQEARRNGTECDARALDALDWSHDEGVALYIGDPTAFYGMTTDR